MDVTSEEILKDGESIKQELRLRGLWDCRGDTIVGRLGDDTAIALTTCNVQVWEP